MSDTAAPRRPLIDAHHHQWDLDRHPQPWLEAQEHRPLRRSFGSRDLRAAATRSIAGRRLSATVVVQAIASDAETRDLLALAEGDPLIAAVVGWADLASPALGDRLDELAAAPGGRHLRALRHLVQDEADPAWLQRPGVERGLSAVAARGLGYDLLIRSHQFGQAIRLAERQPELPLVLDHAGKPPIAGGNLDDWERQLRRLAGHPRVVCKISGLITEANTERWNLSDLRPVWDVLISAFGVDRLMFGSDWPVCDLAGGWDRWAGAVEDLLAASGCSDPETDALLSGTATAFYRLEPPKGP